MSATNTKGESLAGTASDFTESIVSVYVSDGPFMDSLDKSKMFDNVIDEIISMEIHSSLDSFYRYGFVVFPDRIGFRETLSLTGNEIITVRYGNSMYSLQTPPKSIYFNIYDIEEVALSDNNRDRYTNKAIKLHLIEAPMFLLYNFTAWARAYGEDTGIRASGESINNIITTHLTNDLNITKNNFVSLDILPVSSMMVWNNPYWKSQKMISYLLQFAQDDLGNGDYKFFTTTDVDSNTTIINLKNIYQLFTTQNDIQTYSAVNIGPFISSLTPEGTSVSKALNNLITFKFESYDLTSVVSGLSGGYIYNRDYVTGKLFIQASDYVSLNRTQKYFGNVGLWSDTITNWRSMDYKIGPLPPSIAEAYVKNQMSKQRYQLKCLATSYLNHGRNCGDKIDIKFPSVASAIDPSRTLDEQMSGTWLIQEMVDYIVNNRGYSNISFIKDSFFNTVSSSTNKGGTEKLPSVETMKIPGE
jgi:hypothetical protein